MSLAAVGVFRWSDVPAVAGQAESPASHTKLLGGFPRSPAGSLRTRLAPGLGREPELESRVLQEGLGRSPPGRSPPRRNRVARGFVARGTKLCATRRPDPARCPWGACWAHGVLLTCAEGSREHICRCWPLSQEELGASPSAPGGSSRGWALLQGGGTARSSREKAQDPEQKEGSRIGRRVQVRSSFVLAAGTRVARGSTQAEPCQIQTWGVSQ